MDPIVVTTTQARWAPPDVAQPSFPSAQPAPSNRFHPSRASLPLSPARLETNKRLVQVRHAYAHGPENAVQRSTLGDLSGLSLFLSLSLSLYTPPADAYAVTPRGKVPSHRVRRIRSRHACTTYRDRETCMPCSFFLLFFFSPPFFASSSPFCLPAIFLHLHVSLSSAEQDREGRTNSGPCAFIRTPRKGKRHRDAVQRSTGKER